LRAAISQTTLRTDAPAPSWSELAYKPPQPETVMDFLNKYQFKSIIKQIETGNFFHVMSYEQRALMPDGLSPPGKKSNKKKTETVASESTEEVAESTSAKAPKNTRRKIPKSTMAESTPGQTSDKPSEQEAESTTKAPKNTRKKAEKSPTTQPTSEQTSDESPPKTTRGRKKAVK